MIDKVLSSDGDPGTDGLNTAYVAPTYGGYWSSTELNSDFAWYYDFNHSGDTSYGSADGKSSEFNFSTGNVNWRVKERPYRVRAVRRFGPNLPPVR